MQADTVLLRACGSSPRPCRRRRLRCHCPRRCRCRGLPVPSPDLRHRRHVVLFRAGVSRRALRWRMSGFERNWCHAASILCSVAPLRALRFLGDGSQLGRWALGSMQTQEVLPGLFRGVSMFDGSSSLIKPVTHTQFMQVDYLVGEDPARLRPRIVARVVPHGETEEPTACIVSLIAWRSAGMDDGRWARLVACHDAEVHLIRALLEQAPH